MDNVHGDKVSVEAHEETCVVRNILEQRMNTDDDSITVTKYTCLTKYCNDDTDTRSSTSKNLWTAETTNTDLKETHTYDLEHELKAHEHQRNTDDFRPALSV
jgi:hypothetical protein